MCPPAVELDEYSTDETVIKFLMQLKGGQSLPSNVLSEVNPYQVTPSNLPVGMWYFCSGSKTDTKNGFWRSTGDACEIYKTPLTIGFRQTLQFYEGPANDGKKTNWIMQEYTTTETCTSKLDPRALYRVFMVDDSSSGSGHLPNSELLVNNIDNVAGQSDVADRSSDQLLDDIFSEGDFLELNDLDIPLSRSTSSADSSCMTSMSSEQGDDFVDQEMQDSSIKLNLCAPAKLKQVVIQPTTLGSTEIDTPPPPPPPPPSIKESKPCTGQTSKTDPTPENKSSSNEVNTSPQPPSSSSSEGSSKEEKKERANRTKKRKMMKYFCFLAF